MAGVSVGGGGIDKTKIAIETLKSREFLSEFIIKHKLKPDVLAARSWDVANNRIIYDDEVYDAKTKIWAWKTRSQWKKETEPSDQEAISGFQEAVSLSFNDKNSLVNISVSHLSPFVAQKWVQWLINDINQHMREQDVAVANKSIRYLEEKLEETSLAEMQKIFYELIEAQTKTKMLAEIRDEYVLKVIDAATVPELKSRPKRSLICILGVLLGVVLGMIVAFSREMKEKGFSTGELYKKTNQNRNS